MLLPILLLTAPLPDLPKTAAKVEAFVPKGFALEARIDGDLDGDDPPDAALVLLQNATEGEERGRAIIVLRGTKAGFALLASNVGLAACFQCLGAKGGDATPIVSIEKRVLIVQQFGGSREGYGSVYRFRLEKGELRLIGVDHSNNDSLTGASDSKSENLLTGAVVEESNPGPGNPGKATRKRSKAPVKPLPAFEAANEAQ